MNATPGETTFKLVFDGRFVAGRNAVDVEQEFASRFGEAAARSVFGSTPVTIKRGLSREQALQQQRLFERLGIVVSVIPVSSAQSELSLADPTSNATAAKQPAPNPARTVAEQQTATFGVLPERAATPRPEATGTYSTADLDNAFRGVAEIPPASRSYSLRLVPVAALMLLLPLVYLGITALSAYCVFWVATSGLDWFMDLGGSAYFRLIGFAALLFGTLLLTVFFLRPFLARAEGRAQPVRLEPGREPALFHLVERLTEEIGAPMPHEILVDTDVNASARLTRGVFSRELTLTIGLPLFYGISVQSLTGVLTHEFGHFTQQWGMRTAYLIHRINYWFYRQSHERDNWDKFVDELAEHDMIVLTFAAALAHFGSFVSRLILAALLYLASLFSFSLSRQMEFDADRYQIAVLGSEEYGRTAEAMRLLGAGHYVAVQDLAMAFDGDRMVDNLPKLAVMKTQNFSGADRQKIIADVEEVNKSVFDTHPTDKARTRRARQANMPQQFVLAGPAEKLLVELDRLARLATLQWYRSLGVNVSPDDLVPLDQFESEAESLGHADQASSRYFGGLGLLPEFPVLLKPRVLENVTEEKLVSALSAIRFKLEQNDRRFAESRQQLDLNLEYQYYYRQALFWRRAGFDIDLNAYRLKLTTSDAAEITTKLENYRKREVEHRTVLRSCAELLGQRISLGLELAARSGDLQRGELAELHRAYVGMAATDKDDTNLRDSSERLERLLQIAADLPNEQKYARQLATELRSNRELQGRIRRSLAVLPDPLADGETLADALPNAPSVQDSTDTPTILADAARMIRQITRIRFKLEGRMAEMASAAENGSPVSEHSH